MVFIDLDKEYKITKNDLLYKCGWSPFEGTKFKGKIEKTILNGTLVYDKGKINSKSAAKELTFNR